MIKARHFLCPLYRVFHLCVSIARTLGKVFFSFLMNDVGYFCDGRLGLQCPVILGQFSGIKLTRRKSWEDCNSCAL